jgi:Ca2+-binding RTX toxin-like protein
VLLGGAGDDFLAGDSGRDLLIGGAGADRILGNADDDILIAGTTDFDANAAALALVMQEWTRADATFATRVSHLLTGGGLNAGYLLTDSTVHDDHAADVLTGESGNDWFLFNVDGDGGVKDKATDMSTFESQYATDLDWMNSI